MRCALVVAGFLALTGAAQAAVSPRPGGGDPHIQTVPYDAQEVVELKVAMGYALTVEFSSDERIETVSVGNSGAWQVTADKEASRLFVKPMQSSIDTDMTVVTDMRVYAFELRSSPTPDPSMAYFVRFQYPVAPQPPDEIATPSPPASKKPRKTYVTVISYHFSGPADLKPTVMNDDGKATYIIWPDKTPIPAVSVVHNGRATLANGAIRDGRYVIPEVVEKYVFRFAGETAEMVRRVKKVRQK
jgi:type IV secretion system protein VirB9